jgi:hypothetical protein
MSMLQAACCCNAYPACPACEPLPSTISATWNGTYTNPYGCDPTVPSFFGDQTVSISGTFTLYKSCDPSVHTYRGVACNLGTVNNIRFSCDPNEYIECVTENIFASVCASCYVNGDGTVEWTVFITLYSSDIREECYGCSCDQLYVTSVVGNTCALLVDPYCNLVQPSLSDCPGNASKTGSSVFGTYTFGSGTIVIS